MTNVDLKLTAKWVRAPDGALAGVCKGLARALDWPVGWVRLVWIVSVLWFGVGFFVYLGLAITLPSADKIEEAQKPVLLGVCSRLAKKGSGEVGLLRFLALSLGVLSLGATVIGYLVLHLVLDESNRSPDRLA